MERLTALRQRLVKLARRHGCEPADAEDAAQVALQALVEQGAAVHTPEAYATRVVLKQASRHHRDRARRALIASCRARELARLAGDDPPSPIELCERRERWLLLAAALEQFVVFDTEWPRGRTLAVVPSLEHADPRACLDDLRFYAAVIDALPRAARHKQRARNALFDGVADAHRRAGWAVLDPQAEVESGDWHRLHVPLRDGGEERLSPRMMRGCTLALRLCPGLTMDEAVAAVRRAHAAIFGEADAAAATAQAGNGVADRAPVFLHDAAPGDAPGAFAVADLAAKIRCLQARRDPEAQLTIGDGRVEVIGLRMDGGRLCAVAISNRLLPFRRRRSGSQIRRLRELGWRRPAPGAPRFYTRSWRVAGDAGRSAVAAELDRVLAEVYGVTDDDEVQTVLIFAD